jgi:hypothetical protein
MLRNNKFKGKIYTPELTVHGRTISKCVLMKAAIKIWIGFILVVTGFDGGLLIMIIN